MRPINVLRLFDGISSGRVALERAGIKVGGYCASEIDKHAIQISKKNWPEIIQLGDVQEWRNWGIDWSSVDLLLAGSPCTNLSMAGKRGGLVGASALFYNFLQIKETHNPKYWLLENVPMLQEYEDEISNLLGVKPVKICSSFFSAQKRNRLYWTNIPFDKTTVATASNLADILDIDGVPFNYSSSGRGNGVVDKRINEAKKALTLTATGYSRRSYTGVFDPKALSSRDLTINEMEKLQTLDTDYTQGVSDRQRIKAIGNGWTVDVIAHILKGVKDELS